MDSNFFYSPSLFESQEFNSFNFESLLSDELGEQSPSDILSSPSLTGDESVFDSPVTSPSRQDISDTPPSSDQSSEGGHNNIFYFESQLYDPDPIDLAPSCEQPEVEVKQEIFSSPIMTMSPMTMSSLPSMPLDAIPPATILIKESSEIDDDDLEKRGTKRTRKRRKMASPKKVSVTNDRNTVTLTREELLSFSSEQFEDFVSQVTDVRELSTSEKNDLKRQRRLIKNRESAHASRQRKKSHIDELERRVKELTNENSLLKDNTTLLSNENSQLKNQVFFLQTVVNKSGMTNFLNRGVNFLSTLGGKQSQQLPPNSIPATSLVLMIVLFSFGLFFNFGLAGQKPQFPAMEPLPDVIKARVFHHEEYEATAQSKDFLNVLAEQEVPVRRLEQAYRRHLARDSTKEVLTDPIPDLTTQEPQVSLSQPQTSPVVEPTNTPVTPVSEVSVVSRPQILHWKSNTTYLLCENVSQMLPPVHVLQNGMQEDTDNPPMISFLIPPDALGGVGCNSQMEGLEGLEGLDSTGQTNETVSPGYLEVTCQVLDMNFLANVSPVC